MIDFTQVEATIQATKQEVAEHDAAVAALEVAKSELAVVQTQVAEKQAAVATAAETSNKEKADVVSGINSAITALQDLLLQLQ